MNLFETLIAVAITAVMFTLTSVALLPSLGAAKATAAQVEMNNLKSGMVVFQITRGRLPKDFDELCQSKVATKCNNLDPFGNRYRSNGKKIRSAGADGEFNTNDDIEVSI